MTGASLNRQSSQEAGFGCVNQKSSKAVAQIQTGTQLHRVVTAPPFGTLTVFLLEFYSGNSPTTELRVHDGYMCRGTGYSHIRKVVRLTLVSVVQSIRSESWSIFLENLGPKATAEEARCSLPDMRR